MPTPNPAQRLNMLIDESAAHARIALDEYTAMAKRSAARLSGTDPKPKGEWQDDALAWWSAVYRDSMKAMSLWQRTIEFSAAASAANDDAADNDTQEPDDNS